MQPRQSILSTADIEDYLVQLYFGGISDPLTTCLDRAYRDFNRTMHGLRQIDGKSSLHKRARNLVWTEVDKLRSTQKIYHQDDFDYWHQNTCLGLAGLYAECKHYMFAGQAQKWINMTIKYIFTLGDKRSPGFNHIYHLAHIPIDNIIIRKLRRYKAPKLTKRWSRLDDYQEYLAFQKWIRTNFETNPLDTEFLLWLGKDPTKKRE